MTAPVAASNDQIAVSDAIPGILGLLTCGGPRGTWPECARMAKPELAFRLDPGPMSPER